MSTADTTSPSTAAPPPPTTKITPPRRDLLLHLEAYLARRDGVDKLLKIFRYAAKLALSSPRSQTLTLIAPRLRSFESSVGLSRKAFRLGKFVQDLNALRAVRSPSPLDRALALLAYGGEGTYYFVEQFVWLAKAGLVPKEHLKRLQYASAWAELIGYLGSVAMKFGEVRRLRSMIEKIGDEEEGRELVEKLAMKRLSIVQDLADALMALSDVRDGKGAFTGPALMASAGLVSAVISAHKNWCSC